MLSDSQIMHCDRFDIWKASAPECRKNLNGLGFSISLKFVCQIVLEGSIPKLCFWRNIAYPR